VLRYGGKGIQSRRCLLDANVDAQPSRDQERHEVDAWTPERGPGVYLAAIFTLLLTIGRSLTANGRADPVDLLI